MNLSLIIIYFIIIFFLRWEGGGVLFHLKYSVNLYGFSFFAVFKFPKCRSLYIILDNDGNFDLCVLGERVLFHLTFSDNLYVFF